MSSRSSRQALTFTRSGETDVIGRMSVTGRYAEYPILTHLAGARGIAAAPDGALWFTESIRNKIGGISTPGQVREFPLPSAPNVQCGQLCPGEITVGPDGALWFVNTQLVGVPGIGRIATNGVITMFTLPAHSVRGYSQPVVRQVPTAITAGRDSNLWFAEDRGPGLGNLQRATTSADIHQHSRVLGSHRSQRRRQAGRPNLHVGGPLAEERRLQRLPLRLATPRTIRQERAEVGGCPSCRLALEGQ